MRIPTCITAAQILGLQLLRPPQEQHLWVPPHANTPRRPGVRLHRAGLLVPVGRQATTLGMHDVLSHAAVCLPELEALILWESALRRGLVHDLTRIAWPGPRQRRLARLAGGRSDSLLESIMAYRLREAGFVFEQQAVLLGHRVDFLIGRVVLQLDGYAFHQEARQRRADIAHDAQLLLRGFLVVRKDYVQVVHQWHRTLDELRALVAGGGGEIAL